MSAPVIKVFDSLSADYERAFETFLAHTNQKDRAREWLDGVVAGLVRRDVLIDAGAGNGKVTQWYVNDFNRTIAIEPNPFLRDQLTSHCPTAEVLAEPIINASPGVDGDLVLCSHVFYYIDQEDWLATLQALAGFLSQTGSLVVVLQNSLTDCMDLLEHFHKRRFNLAEAGNAFREASAGQFTTKIETVSAEIRTPDLNTAFEIAEFMLNLLPFDEIPLAAEVREFVHERFALDTGGYRMTCSQDCLTIGRVSP